MYDTGCASKILAGVGAGENVGWSATAVVLMFGRQGANLLSRALLLTQVVYHETARIVFVPLGNERLWRPRTIAMP